MRALLQRLDHPQTGFRGALIGGTNGKGSTQAMVASVLSANGLVVGQTPSPHLASYRERIVVDGSPIAWSDLDAVLDEALAAAAPGERRFGPATEFELLVAAAFLWFARRRVDVAVIEVGLGGRLDATNIWDGGVAAITNVGLDHQQYLGSTVVQIAREKAAIIKRGDRAVTGATGDALAVIERRAARMDAPILTRAAATGARDGSRRPHRGGPGDRTDAPGPDRPASGRERGGGDRRGRRAGRRRHRERGSTTAIRRGLAAARWPGRLETIVVDGVTAILDGAHNPDGAAALVGALAELRPSLPDGRATLLLGILADKEVDDMLALLASDPTLRNAKLVATDVPDAQRTLAASALGERWSSIVTTTAQAEAIADADEALRHALDLAREAGGPLIVAGSLYLVGHVRALLLGESPRPDDERPTA